jgi:hypothetical protein
VRDISQCNLGGDMGREKRQVRKCVRKRRKEEDEGGFKMKR